MTRRVAVTGIGLVTPVGTTTTHSWQALCRGDSGITTLEDPLIASYPVRIAGRVTGEQPQIDALLSPKEQHKADRFIQLSLLAAVNAIDDAQLLLTDEEKLRTGVYTGVSIGGLGSIVEAAELLADRGMRRISPYLIPKLITNEAAGAVSIRYGLQGPAMSMSSACSSGADAIGQAYRAITSGICDVMIAGGTESVIEPIAIAGFGNMRALAQWDGDPTQASRPFDARRCGFVIAEGAGMLVLEDMDRAVAREATIYAEMVGYAATADAYHTTALHPEGRGARNAIEQAIAQSGAQKNEIGYINAHGTSTKMNDAVESAVIASIFDEHRPLVSSTKSMTGHMLGAAGGVEAGITALALHHRMAPPTINLDTPDKGCALNHVRESAQSFEQEYALSNSFGFGGSNAVLMFKRG